MKDVLGRRTVRDVMGLAEIEDSLALGDVMSIGDLIKRLQKFEYEYPGANVQTMGSREILLSYNYHTESTEEYIKRLNAAIQSIQSDNKKNDLDISRIQSELNRFNTKNGG